AHVGPALFRRRIQRRLERHVKLEPVLFRVVIAACDSQRHRKPEFVSHLRSLGQKSSRERFGRRANWTATRSRHRNLGKTCVLDTRECGNDCNTMLAEFAERLSWARHPPSTPTPRIRSIRRTSSRVEDSTRRWLRRFACSWQ